MALITRLSRLFTADFHAVLDRIEEPEILLKQALREMDEELARNEQGVKQLEREVASLSDRENAARTTIQKLEQDLDICFESGKEELARAITRRKLETERQLLSIASQQDKTRQALSEAQNLLVKQHARLETTRQKAELLCEQKSPHVPATADDSHWMAGQFSVTDDEVEVAWLREKQRRNRA